MQLQNTNIMINRQQNPTTLADCLQLLCDKIDERFTKVAAAFRYFDLHSKGKIAYADFSFIVDQLHIKFTRR